MATLFPGYELSILLQQKKNLGKIMFKMDVKKDFFLLMLKPLRLPRQYWHSPHISDHDVMQSINNRLKPSIQTT